jgi:hypothetical protein
VTVDAGILHAVVMLVFVNVSRYEQAYGEPAVFFVYCVLVFTAVTFCRVTLIYVIVRTLL